MQSSPPEKSTRTGASAPDSAAVPSPTGMTVVDSPSTTRNSAVGGRRWKRGRRLSAGAYPAGAVVTEPANPGAARLGNPCASVRRELVPDDPGSKMDKRTLFMEPPQF